MKNTELIKVKNILAYKGEFDKVCILSKDIYTAREAAMMFGCTMAQIKGYLNNYKQYFEGYVEVVGTPGRQETRINKEGIFLLALLLDKRSSLAGKVANRVRESIANSEKIEAVQQKIDIEKVHEEKIEKDTTPKEKAILNILNAVIEAKEQETKKKKDLDIDQVNQKLLEHHKKLKIDNLIFDSYITKCKILGLEEIESAILIQESFVNDEDIDKKILNVLYAKAQKEFARKRGVLRESIQLLASEKFDGQAQEAYHFLSNELRFYLGIDMRKIREKHKDMNINPTSYLDLIISENGYDYAMDIISTLLSE